MAWDFVLTDSSFRPVGIIRNAKDRNVALPLNRLATASFKVRLDNPAADALVGTDCYVKAYRNRVLQFMGPVVTSEEAADKDSHSVAVNVVDMGWVLQRRLTGKNTVGRQFTSLTDRALIIETLIAEANAEWPSGVSPNSGVPGTSGSQITYTAGPYKPLIEVVNELSASYDGFDWRIVPRETYIGGTVTSQYPASFTAAAAWGTYKPEAVFEYGSGRRNVESYKRTVNRDTLANSVYHLSQDQEAGSAPVVSSTDTASIQMWGLVEDLVTADLTDVVLRQQLTDAHIRVRRAPRQVIEVTPHIDPSNSGRLPKFGDDFDVGDWVRARAAYSSTVRFDAMFRVWGVSFAIDDLGTEKMTLALVENQ